MMMLLCFAVGWPLSILKTLRSKTVKGKSPFFIMVVMAGYAFGITHKILSGFDWVSYLYVFNFIVVSIDLFLYFHFRKSDRVQNEKI